MHHHRPHHRRTVSLGARGGRDRAPLARPLLRPRFAGQRVWTDYWIPGHKGYTSGASGTADSTGDIWLTFRLIAPPTGAELDILSSVSDGPSHTDPAHKWVTINC